MHAIEKILAKNSGREQVSTGEIVTAKVDFAEINDLYLQTVYSFYEMGGEMAWDSDQESFLFDQEVRSHAIKSCTKSLQRRIVYASILIPTVVSAIR